MPYMAGFPPLQKLSKNETVEASRLHCHLGHRTRTADGPDRRDRRGQMAWPKPNLESLVFRSRSRHFRRGAPPPSVGREIPQELRSVRSRGARAIVYVSLLRSSHTVVAPADRRENRGPEPPGTAFACDSGPRISASLHPG